MRITATTTGKVPNTSPTAASSGSDLNGMAAQQAAATIKSRLIDFAAKQWKVPKSRIRFEDGQVLHRQPRASPSATWRARRTSARVSLSATGFYTTPKITWDRAKAKGRPFFYFAYGAACSEVTIDTLTGEMRVDRVDILHDVGRSLNPAHRHRPDRGRLRAGHGLAHHRGTGLRRARAGCAPMRPRPTRSPAPPTCRRISASSCSKSRGNKEDTIYRSKAVGEPPLMLGISVWTAIFDAIASLKPGQIPPLDAPATPEAILKAVKGMAGMKVWAMIARALEAHGTCAMVSVVKAEGSVPREEGARMVVTPEGFHGTIGGGTLEWKALAEAQRLLGKPRAVKMLTQSLGPDLGQCCGGRVSLAIESFDALPICAAVQELGGARGRRPVHASRAASPGRTSRERFGEARRSVLLFGAGHVGRAADAGAGAAALDVTWADPRPEAFPAAVPQNVTTVQPANPLEVVQPRRRARSPSS